MTKIHYKRIDFRIASLEYTIEALELAINKIKIKSEEVEWFNWDWVMEQSEPIIGTAFVAFQNYINSSIYDGFENLDQQFLLYKTGNAVPGFESTQIELIIGLANYYKHRDHPTSLHKHTEETLNSFQLYFCEEQERSTILKGLELLSSDWELSKIIPIVKNWRDELWIEVDFHNSRNI